LHLKTNFFCRSRYKRFSKVINQAAVGGNGGESL